MLLINFSILMWHDIRCVSSLHRKKFFFKINEDHWFKMLYLSKEDLKRKKDSMVWYPNDFVVSQEGLLKASCKLMCMCDFITKLHKIILVHWFLLFTLLSTTYPNIKVCCLVICLHFWYLYMSCIFDPLYIKIYT